MNVLRFQPHEHDAQLLFADPEAGLSPFFAIARQFSDALENEETFTAAGHQWQLNHDDDKVQKWTGAIAGRPEDSFDRFNEYNLGLKAVDEAPPHNRTVNFQFRLALPNATHADTGEPIGSLPDDLPEGVRVQVRSVNLEPEAVIEVLQELAAFLDIRRDYFAREHLHPWSRLSDLAVYVRLERSVSQRTIVNREGLLENLATFSSRRSGRGKYVWDNEEIVGHRNTVSINPTGLENLELEHDTGHTLKSYHVAIPAADPSDDPTTHPKLECRHSADHSVATDNKTVPWEPDHADPGEPDRRSVRRELEETLASALKWADLPLDPTTEAAADVYVPDDYWSLEERQERDVSLPELSPTPLEELQERQEELATHHMAAKDPSDAERDVLQALTDGGMHYEELAEQADVSVSSVYRTAERFEDLIETAHGELRFANSVVQERITDFFEAIDRALQWARNGVDRVVSEEDTGDLEADDTAFAKWARAYGAQVRDEFGDLEIVLRAGNFSKYDVRRILIEGFRSADMTGFNTRQAFGDATVRWTDEKGRERTREKIRYRQGRGPGSLRILGAQVTLD